MSTNETVADIVREMRNLGKLDEKSTDKIPRSLMGLGLRTYADRLEAARKIERDSIHCAKVLIAGIEMENSENPPRLWTALEDAYDALCNADGTDGDIAANMEEAKATGRHFVVKPFGNEADMREALQSCLDIADSTAGLRLTDVDNILSIHDIAKAALAATPMNCDRYTTADEAIADFADEALIEEWNLLKAGKARDILAEELFMFANWLFSTAVERKGEGDGK